MSVPANSLQLAGNTAINTAASTTRAGSAGLRNTVKRTISHVPTAAHDKFVQVRLTPLIPMILAASALTFHEGQQKKLAEESHSKASSSWQGIVAESTLGYLLLKYTSGVYPLLGLGLAICRASKENNALDQLKAVITTAVTMGMGFVGANLMHPDLLEKRENGKIKSLLETGGEEGEKLGRWFDSLKTEGEEGFKVHLQQIGEHFGELKAHLQKLPELEGKKHPKEKAAFRELLADIEQTKGHLAERINQSGVAQEAMDLAEKYGAKDTAHALMKKVAEGQSTLTKIGRTVNPVCCFMFSAFLLGSPLANWINSHLEQKQPDLKKKGMKQVLFPENQRVLKVPGGHGGEHGGGHSYNVNPGPYITCPDVGDGRPMQ